MNILKLNSYAYENVITIEIERVRFYNIEPASVPVSSSNTATVSISNPASTSTFNYTDPSLSNRLTAYNVGSISLNLSGNATFTTSRDQISAYYNGFNTGFYSLLADGSPTGFFVRSSSVTASSDAYLLTSDVVSSSSSHSVTVNNNASTSTATFNIPQQTSRDVTLFVNIQFASEVPTGSYKMLCYAPINNRISFSGSNVASVVNVGYFRGLSSQNNFISFESGYINTADNTFTINGTFDVINPARSIYGAITFTVPNGISFSGSVGDSTLPSDKSFCRAIFIPTDSSLIIDSITSANGANNNLNNTTDTLTSEFESYKENTDTTLQYDLITDNLFTIDTNIWTQMASTSTLFSSFISGIFHSLGDLSSSLTFFLIASFVSAIIGIARVSGKGGD